MMLSEAKCDVVASTSFELCGNVILRFALEQSLGEAIFCYRQIYEQGEGKRDPKHILAYTAICA